MNLYNIIYLFIVRSSTTANTFEAVKEAGQRDQNLKIFCKYLFVLWLDLTNFIVRITNAVTTGVFGHSGTLLLLNSG